MTFGPCEPEPGHRSVIAVVVAVIVCVLWAMAWLSLAGCATLDLDRPVCAVRRSPVEVAYCCEAGVTGVVEAGVVAVDVVGIVEGCARLRMVLPEAEVGR